MSYIKREVALYALREGWQEARGILENLPSADVVEVVRCKDCKHRSKSQWIINLDGTEKRYKCDCIGEYMLECNFCSFGERYEE